MQTKRSKKIFHGALKKIPGGVNSPVRAWKAVGGQPLCILRGKGSSIFDADGNRYIDFVGSWGPLILGHAPAKIVQTIKQQAKKGFTFGAPTAAEVELAEIVSKHVPSIQKLRLVNSGTEATMSAIRLARAFTARTKIVKFDGCYHGHSDGLLVKAGSGVATLGLPDSPGVPAGFAQETLIARYNDIQSVQRAFDDHGKNIAAVIVEPICGNMGVILPAANFLAQLREITRRYEALLIFDEVITGFRVALGGAQRIFNVKPDLTCLGKILGGGFPLAAFGGRREIMDLLAPLGPVYQAGTLSGNPVAVAAGITTLRMLRASRTYKNQDDKGKKLEQGLVSVLAKQNIRGVINRFGSMLTLFFGVDHVTDADEARQCDREKFSRFFHGMLKRGIYLPPAPF
ncbi:MAG TPA: glutamate-1-semialdehyde 2,1-aminomutase, partial [Candidatus Binatia bacterium]|nr:glutamate-1-semialdehyde 2,1-aminomutase [Candidatus Binatia bacterium]